MHKLNISYNRNNGEFEMISIKSAREIEIMTESCQLAAKTLNFIADKLEIGMTTEDVNVLCHDFIIANNAIHRSTITVSQSQYVLR
jgi:methionine aminopeptidase